MAFVAAFMFHRVKESASRKLLLFPGIGYLNLYRHHRRGSAQTKVSVPVAAILAGPVCHR